MPLPRLLAEINKRVFNPRQLKNDKWVVLTHRGRSSGTDYQTPLEAFRDGDSYLFILMYGTESDWVKNVMASGHAKLRDKSGEVVGLESPRLVAEAEFWTRIPADTKPPAGFMNVHDFLEMEIAA
ncbi:MAG: nitroreductase family deazaflavin-dependent oxidoreductase [Acidimicrobiia bacterium]|nr:nitroreductase family deazaflavin-dependent oxidoreductase [Acidimicrobiia bacterium]